MKYLFIICILLTLCLGVWQTARFVQKSRILQRLESCTLNEVSSLSPSYCKYHTSDALLGDSVFFLFMDYYHTYVMVPFEINGELLFANIGYTDNSNKEKIRNLFSLLDKRKKVDLTGFLIPYGRRMPMVNNNLDKGELYYMDNAEFEAKLNKGVIPYMLHTSADVNLFHEQNLLVVLPKPKVKVYMHIWYAIMWYAISIFGMIFFYVIQRSDLTKA